MIPQPVSAPILQESPKLFCGLAIVWMKIWADGEMHYICVLYPDCGWVKTLHRLRRPFTNPTIKI
jgi:hypothetical protein